MSSFSERIGITARKTIQVRSMDNDLRNGLWNALTIHYWQLENGGNFKDLDFRLRELISGLWFACFKEPIDLIPYRWLEVYREIRKRFFDLPWDRVYDFIEFTAKSSYESINEEFMKDCNLVLEREVSAYRFVGGKIVAMTSEEEIAEVERALVIPDSLRLVRDHLKRSLNLLSDRQTPDYRNSIKESISAVEALCNLIANSKGATLGQALKLVEKKVPIHQALKSAFSSLYGYTSSAEGIRHALADEPNLKPEDAMFMLVSCSAFINYLVAKSSEAGIEF